MRAPERAHHTHRLGPNLRRFNAQRRSWSGQPQQAWPLPALLCPTICHPLSHLSPSPSPARPRGSRAAGRPRRRGHCARPRPRLRARRAGVLGAPRHCSRTPPTHRLDLVARPPQPTYAELTSGHDVRGAPLAAATSPCPHPCWRRSSRSPAARPPRSGRPRLHPAQLPTHWSAPSRSALLIT